MTGAGESIKPAPPIAAYLTEQMSVARMVEALEGLRFNKKYGQGHLVIDEGVQAFLLAATKAAAVDPNAKVRHVWRGIKPRHPPSTSAGKTHPQFDCAVVPATNFPSPLCQVEIVNAAKILPTPECPGSRRRL